MDEMLDKIWVHIEVFLAGSVAFIDRLLSPLEVLGPVAVVSLLALVSVLVTVVLRRVYTTKRYTQLQETFDYWHQLRQEAMAQADKEKGKALAKNIDQAELNRVYYDFFFEGLMKNLVTTMLPIFLTLAYVNAVYQPDGLRERFGSGFLFVVGVGSTSQKIGSVFWFFLSLLGAFLLVEGVKFVYKRHRMPQVINVR